MSKFVKSKILKIAIGVFLSSSIFVGSFMAMYFGKSILNSSFIIGSLLIALAPLCIFLTAFFYQGSVVFSIRQVSVESLEKMSLFEKKFIRTAKGSYEFAKSIPLLITVFAAILSITFIPGSIGNAAFQNGHFIEVSIASLLISGNFILFLRMANQIYNSSIGSELI